MMVKVKKLFTAKNTKLKLKEENQMTRETFTLIMETISKAIVKREEWLTKVEKAFGDSAVQSIVTNDVADKLIAAVSESTSISLDTLYDNLGRGNWSKLYDEEMA